MKPSKKLLKIIILINIIALAVTLFGASTEYHKYKNSHSWLEAECLIISSEVKSTNEAGGSKKVLYTPSIYYTYQVNGDVYRSSSYRLAELSTSSYEENKAVVDSYVSGETYPCFYNPNNSQDSALDIKPNKADIILHAFVLALFLIGLIINLAIYTGFGYHRK